MALEDWCNVFRFCTCLNLLGNVMMLVIPALCGVSVYGVWVAYGSIIKAGGTQGFLVGLALAIFCLLIALTLYAYYAAALIDPGHVPPGWHPFASAAEADLERDRLEEESVMSRPAARLTGTGRPRYCRKCEAWKPERAHHDSTTGKCVLKMDHYCLWIQSCVGLLNQKAFLLFLLYCMLACLLGAGLLVRPLIDFFRRLTTAPPDASIVVVFVGFMVDLTFALCLILFVGMHIRLVLLNCTTIEMYEKRRVANWPYQRGWRRNIADVFGPDWRTYGVPVHTAEFREALLSEALGASNCHRTQRQDV